jgi:hypothetical protein
MKTRPRPHGAATTIVLSIVLLSVSVITVSYAADVSDKSLCDIQRGKCSQKTPDGITIEFDIQPKPVAAMSELTFFIALIRSDKPFSGASSVILDLSMPGMYMGKNRPALKPLGDGRYEGKGIIMRCLSGRRAWQAEVTFKRGEQTSVADFIFEVN